MPKSIPVKVDGRPGRPCPACGSESLHVAGSRFCQNESDRRASSETDRLLRRVAALEGRLARVLRYAHGYFGHMGTGVWSRRLTPPRRTGGGK
jgi:hypothetical protein